MTTYSFLAKDLERNPEIFQRLKEKLQREVNLHGPTVSIATRGDVITVTAA